MNDIFIVLENNQFGIIRFIQFLFTLLTIKYFVFLVDFLLAVKCVKVRISSKQVFEVLRQKLFYLKHID